MSGHKCDVCQGLEDELDALWRFAHKLTGHTEDAADLVQRTCLRALEQRDNYSPEGKMRSWLFRIEHRIWLNELRSRQIRNHRSFSTGAADAAEMSGATAVSHDMIAGDSPESSVLLHQVYTAVEALPEAQRLAMLLVSVEGFSYREAAEILDVPIGTVMSRLARARASLGAQMLSTVEPSNANTTLSGIGARL